MSFRSFIFLALAHSAALTVGCSVAEGAVGECGAFAEPLFGGGDASDSFSPSPGEAASIVSLELDGTHICTGTVLTGGWILTAKHCAVDDVRVRRPDSASGGARPITIVAHPELDAALLALPETQCTCGVCAQGLAPSNRSVDASLVGTSVTLAGTGLTDEGVVGELRFLDERVTQVAPAEIWVDGHGATGACLGDSGGPMLVRDDEGRPRVLGLLARGAADCRGTDAYTRIDRLREWLVVQGAVMQP